MQIVHGLISADSHVVLDRDAFQSRMSPATWGERIPQVVEIEQNGRRVERWSVFGKVAGGEGGGVCNCPAVMDDPLRNSYPQRWEDVPLKAYDPLERLEALDSDGVDAEVLFPNNPGSTFFQYGDAAFELACVQAYNDALAEWRQASDRFIPLAIPPLLGGIETTVAEVERAVKSGHRGVNMVAEPNRILPSLRHVSDPYWYPLWDVCQELEVPMHVHASGGLGGILTIPRWQGYSLHQAHTAYTVPTAAWPAQLIPNLIFSGIAERFPRLRWVFAECGIGSLNYVMDGCDHEWERRRLWTQGILTRPSEIVHRQMCVNFWYEVAGIELRHKIGIHNIMWESDYPHIASTFPESWDFVERTLSGVPDDERRLLLYENAVRIYKLK
jgi:predicted TIM-barrel fold metal-dependent hydrolase